MANRFSGMEEQAAKERELLKLKVRLSQLDCECREDERKIVEELTIETVCLPHPFEGGAAGDVRKYLDDIARYTADYEARRRTLETELHDAEDKASRWIGKILNWVNGDLLSDSREKLDSFMKKNESKQRLVELRKTFESKFEKLENKKKELLSLRMEIQELERNKINGVESVKTIDGRFVECISKGDSESRKNVHLYNPCSDPGLKKERNLLFLYALQVTREFILESKSMRKNIAFLRTYWGAKDEGADSGVRELIEFTQADRRRMAPALFQALNLLTPVISSTFASVGRMFEDVQIGEDPLFGLLIIDEAGQAVPYAALGALARSRRAMIVGDPSQIEPVITGDVKELRVALGKRVLLPFKGDMASVQRLADAVNPYGHLRSNGEDDQWIGCPLVVHRRCISPMFDISNEISYQGSMLNETANLKKDVADSFYLKSSQWINVAGSERGNRDHYVDSQGDRVYEIVEDAFIKAVTAAKKKDRESGKSKGRVIPSLYIISPFKTVVRGLQNRLLSARPEVVDKDAWKVFVKQNIGTVHTFQGKEAHQVIFVLGCDTSRSCEGAIKFVNPNIVNVAASRAKYRLYVIADYAAWKINENVATMKRILDTAWVVHWERYQKTGNIEELNAAKEMLPRGESLPRETAGADEEHINEDDNKDLWCPDVNTDSYLDNVSEALESYNLDANDCQIIGFSSHEALQSAFADCACDRNGNNRVLENIEQGLLLCKLFGIGRAGTDGDSDCAFCLLMFCRAAERYLRLKLLPTLKTIAPDYVVARKPLKELESLNLGQYGRLIKSKSDLLSSSIRVAGMSLAQGVDADWWNRLGETLDAFTRYRNTACHTGREDALRASEVHDALCCLFAFITLGTAGRKGIAIMRESDIYKAAFIGAECLPTATDGVHNEEDERDAGEAEGPGLVETVSRPFTSADWYSKDRAKEEGYLSISEILDGSGIKARDANTILMKRGYLRFYDEGEESVRKCKVPSIKGLKLGAIIVRGEEKNGEVYFYAQYPKVKAKDICDIIEREL